VFLAPMHEIVKITWRAIAISEWQSINFVKRCEHGIVNRPERRNLLAEITADLAINCHENRGEGKIIQCC
jgi:hypothetical protein